MTGATARSPATQSAATATPPPLHHPPVPPQVSEHNQNVPPQGESWLTTYLALANLESKRLPAVAGAVKLVPVGQRPCVVNRDLRTRRRRGPVAWGDGLHLDTHGGRSVRGRQGDWMTELAGESGAGGRAGGVIDRRCNGDMLGGGQRADGDDAAGVGATAQEHQCLGAEGGRLPGEDPPYCNRDTACDPPHALGCPLATVTAAGWPSPMCDPSRIRVCRIAVRLHLACIWDVEVDQSSSRMDGRPALLVPRYPQLFQNSRGFLKKNETSAHRRCRRKKAGAGGSSFP